MSTTTPTEATMTELLGFVEPWCDGEQVLEDGATFEEEKERQEIYAHHLAAQVALETSTETAVAAAVAAAATAAEAAAAAGAPAAAGPSAAYAAPPAAGGPTVGAPAPFFGIINGIIDDKLYVPR